MTSSALAETSAGLWVPPRYAVPRAPGRLTVGEGVAKVMRALGSPPMPWQSFVADVGGEVWPRGTVLNGEDVSGQLVHGLVVVSVQRQAGKTRLKNAQSIHRCLWRPNRRAWTTAQTGQDARDVWRELVDEVMDSPLARFVAGRPRLQNGAERLTFVNGSTLRPHPPTRDALHGKQSDHNDIDEGWSFDEATGTDLFQAIDPTQSTRPGAQIWVWSTRGDAASTWFHELVDRGYDGAGVALFDWGIPLGADPMDLDVVAAHHPAVGNTIGRNHLAKAQARLVKKGKAGEFARAYGNRETGGRERVIPEPAWEAARVHAELDAELADATPAYGIAVWEPRDGGDVSGALVAARRSVAGVPVVELVEHRPGRAWLAARVLELRDRGQAIAVDRKGPAGTVADALELAGVELLALTSNDVASASQDLRDRLADREAVGRCEDAELLQLGRLRALACCERHGPRVLHRSDPRLDAAVDVAGRRWIGEGAWVFSARESTGDVAALQAMALAVRALDHAPAQLLVGRSVFAA